MFNGFVICFCPVGQPARLNTTGSLSLSVRLKKSPRFFFVLLIVEIITESTPASICGRLSSSFAIEQLNLPIGHQ
jgi:hypothetical protein